MSDFSMDGNFLDEEENVLISRKKTAIERESSKHKDEASEYISHLEVAVPEFIPNALTGAIFCGHLVTDMVRFEAILLKESSYVMCKV